jgi:hypothetical protein
MTHGVFSGAAMDGRSETSTAELLAELDAVLLDLRRRLDDFTRVGGDEIVAVDEGFSLAGLVAASAGEAARHAEATREALRAKIVVD